MSEPFGEERFKYSLFLVLWNRIVSCAVAIVMLMVRWEQRHTSLVLPCKPAAQARLRARTLA